MLARCCVVVGLLVACLAGCNRRGPYMDAYFEMLDAEKRALEDQVYLFQDKYEQTKSELEECRRQLQLIKGGASGEEYSGSGTTSDTPPNTDLPDIDIPDLSPPTVDPGTPTNPPPSSGNGSELRRKPATGSAGRRPSNRLPGPRDGKANTPAEELHSNTIPPRPGDQLNHIVLNHRYTRGIELDDQPGDDGVTVVIQPRTADNRAVGQFGRVSIVLLDPRLVGDNARFARWDFSADEVHQSLKQTATSKEIRLEMKWPGQPPQHNRLHLFVRMVNEQGDRFEADQEIYVNLPGSETARWTPRHSSSSNDGDLSVATRPQESSTSQHGTAPSEATSTPATDTPHVESTSSGQNGSPSPRPKWSPFREDMR